MAVVRTLDRSPLLLQSGAFMAVESHETIGIEVGNDGDDGNEQHWRCSFGFQVHMKTGLTVAIDCATTH